MFVYQTPSWKDTSLHLLPLTPFRCCFYTESILKIFAINVRYVNLSSDALYPIKDLISSCAAKTILPRRSRSQTTVHGWSLLQKKSPVSIIPAENQSCSLHAAIGKSQLSAFRSGPEGRQPQLRSVYHHRCSSEGLTQQRPGLSFHQLTSPARGELLQQLRWFLPLTTHPPTRLEECSAVSPVCSWKRLALLSNAELKPFPRHLLTLHTHSALQEANNYLPGNILNKETKKKLLGQAELLIISFYLGLGFWESFTYSDWQQCFMMKYCLQKHLA